MKYLQNTALLRRYLKLDEVEQILLLCIIFCIALIGVRIIYTGELLFVFLVWNLFLAWLPYRFSKWIAKNAAKKKDRKLFLVFGFAWLMLVPNAFYIVTDLFHMDRSYGVPPWFDLVLLLSFAWNGLLFGIVSVRKMEQLFIYHFDKTNGLFFILPMMFLNGLGVYIGRYLRFNSWDVITNPFQLAKDIGWLFIHPFRNHSDWSMIICYSILMCLIYLAVKRISKVM